MSKEQRAYLRLNVGEMSCDVTLGQEQHTGDLLDESIGGVCVGSLPLLALSVNQPIQVTFDGEIVDGVCRSVSRQSDTTYSIGIRRQEAAPIDDDTTATMLLNSFLTVSGCDVLCIPVLSIDEKIVRVMMIDGRQFDVERSKLVSMTRDERIQRLVAEKKLNSILQLYQLPPTSNSFDARDAIINREFGPAFQFSLAH